MRKISIWFFAVGLSLFMFPICSPAQQATKSEIEANIHPHVDLTPAYASSRYFPKKLPEVDAGDLVGQAVSGIFIGGISAFAAGIITTQLSGCSGWCELGEFFIGASVGYIGGSSLMIHSYNNNPDQKGSYAAVLLGDILGFGLGALTLNGLADSDTRFGRILGGVAFFTFPVGGAMAGYFLTRQPVNPYQPQALINVSRSKSGFSMPSVSFTNVDRFRSLQRPVISLVSVRF